MGTMFRWKVKRMIGQGQVAGAENLLLAQVQKAPADAVEWRGLLGQCAMKRRDYAEAFGCFMDALLQAVPDRSMDPLEQQLASRWRGTLGADFYYSLGEAADRLAKPRESVVAYERALSLNRGVSGVNYTQVHLTMARNCKLLGEFEKAVHHFEQVEKPQFAALSKGDLACEMEACWTALGEVEKAQECMSTALSVRPVRTENMAQAGWFQYTQAGDVVNAVETLKQCLQKDSSRAQTWYMLGRIYLDERRWEAADEALLNACERDGNSVAIWMALGELYSAVGKEEFAMKALQRATELDEGADGAWGLMANMFEKFGQSSNAMAIYDKMDPDDPKVLLRRNEILHKAALRLQRVFRGHQARKKLRAKVQRRVVRNYGARAPLAMSYSIFTQKQPGAHNAVAGEFRQAFEFRA